MNPISPDVFPDAKWSWWNRPMVAIRTRDGVGEVYIMDDTIPSYIGDVQSIAIGEQKYVPERTCKDVNAAVYTFTCSECATEMNLPFGRHLHFCPGCGAKVVK